MSYIQSEVLEAIRHPLFGEWVDGLIHKALEPRSDVWQGSGDSNRGARIGVIGLPYDKQAILQLMNVSPHHSICIQRKVAAISGLGFKTKAEVERDRALYQYRMQAEALANEIQLLNLSRLLNGSAEGASVEAGEEEERAEKALKALNERLKGTESAAHRALQTLEDPFYQHSEIDKKLDDLCMFSFADLMQQVMIDFEHGDGYIEVKRANKSSTTSTANGAGGYSTSRVTAGKIVGLYHIPAHLCNICIETDTGKYHYRISVDESNSGQEPQYFAKFGDTEDFWDRIHGKGSAGGDPYSAITEAIGQDPSRISEVIHFRDPSPQHRYYGYPQWLAALSSIELFRSVNQYKYDFFNNRGIPEFLFLLTGGKLDPVQWQTVLTNLNINKAQIPGKRKSVALNIEDEKIKSELIKLGAAEVDNTFKDDTEVIATNIVTAHSIPPLLANIQIPGRMGAYNELSQAMLSFQGLNIGPKQRIVMHTLGRTLASDKADLGLTADDIHLRRITEEVDLKALDTLGRMRNEYVNTPSRNLDEGVKD